MQLCVKPGSRRDAEGTQGLLPHFTLRLTGHIAQRQCVTAPAQQGPGCSGPSTARAQCCHAPRGQGRTHRSVPPVTPLPRGGLMPAPPGHPPALPDEQVSALVTAPVHAPVPRNRLQTPSWASGTTDRTETPAESQHQFLPVLSPGFMALPEIFFSPRPQSPASGSAQAARRSWPVSVTGPPVTALLSFVITPALLQAE